MGTGESRGSVSSAWLHPAAEIPIRNNKIAATFSRAISFIRLGLNRSRTEFVGAAQWSVILTLVILESTV